MNFKTRLDRYLTTPPEDGFDNWAEEVINAMPDEFYKSNEEWMNSSGGLCNKWLNKLFDKSTEIEYAARVIERAHRRYVGIVSTVNAGAVVIPTVRNPNEIQAKIDELKIEYGVWAKKLKSFNYEGSESYANFCIMFKNDVAEQIEILEWALGQREELPK